MDAEDDILLQAQSLGRRDGGRWRVQALDLHLRRGEVTALLGVNGAGKSTTLALLSGALRPSAGTVTVAGLDLHRQGRRARRRLGLLPERPPLYPQLTLDENLEFAARLRGLAGRRLRRACLRVKRELDLIPWGRRLAGRLSRGMAQRAGIAQALVHDPDVLILDEPTAGLDPAQAAELRRCIGRYARNRAVLLATHLVADVEALCRRLVVLHQGRVALRERLDGARRVRVRFDRPPPPERLAALPEVAEAQPLEGGEFLLHPRVPAAALLQALADRPWSLSAFVPHGRDLEALLAGVVGRERAAS